MATPTESIQTLVREFDAECVPVVVIAERLGISRERVEEVLRESPTVPDNPPGDEPAPPLTLSPEAAARADRLLTRLNDTRVGQWHDGGLLTKEQGAELAQSLNRPPVMLVPKPDRPSEDAVAQLSLPLSVPALVSVLDSLELAYGPDLRVSPAEGGVWVLRRAS